jgi:multiple sugar transport system permease protein
MKQKRISRKAIPYLFILPWIIGFLVFTIGPLIFSLVMSFFDWPLAADPEFVGFGNYIEMFTSDKQFSKSLIISLKYAAIFVPLNMIIALFLAMLITQPVRGVKIFRTIFYIPTVISGVAVSILWGWILNGDYGVLNYLLSLLGIEGPKWLVDPAWAILAVIIASAFGVGSMMLIFYTDIKNIPIDVYEAATIDGANPARQFFSITLPIITPTILFNLITSIISSFQQVTLVMLLTGGGPLKSTYFYGLYTYNNAFKHHKLGYASANAWVMFIIILFLTALVFKSSSAWVFYESEAGGVAKKGKKSKRGGKR